MTDDGQKEQGTDTGGTPPEPPRPKTPEEIGHDHAKRSAEAAGAAAADPEQMSAVLNQLDDKTKDQMAKAGGLEQVAKDRMSLSGKDSIDDDVRSVVGRWKASGMSREQADAMLAGSGLDADAKEQLLADFDETEIPEGADQGEPTALDRQQHAATQALVSEAETSVESQLAQLKGLAGADNDPAIQSRIKEMSSAQASIARIKELAGDKVRTGYRFLFFGLFAALLVILYTAHFIGKAGGGGGGR